MTDIISKSKALEYLRKEIENLYPSRGACAGQIAACEILMQKIQSGAFDIAVDGDVPSAGDIERMLLVDHPIPVGAVTRAYRALIVKLAERDAEIERLRAELKQALEALEWIRDAGADMWSIIKARDAIHAIRGGGAK